MYSLTFMIEASPAFLDYTGAYNSPGNFVELDVVTTNLSPS
jgi:hypothetical protein